MVVLSWCTEMSSEGDMGMEPGLTSVLSAQVWVAEQWDVSWKVAGGTHCSSIALSPRQITLGLSKNVRFLLFQQLLHPLCREGGSQGTTSRHAAWLAHTVLPGWAAGQA